MSLEEIFSEQMFSLKQRINNIGHKYPNLIKIFSLKKNDPHIEQMINSFALISASLEHEVTKKIAKEIQSILINVYPEEFAPIPPSGTVKITPNNGKFFKISKQTKLSDNKILFMTRRDTFVGDVYIKGITKTFLNNNYGLEINLTGNNLSELSTIDLFIDIKTINAILGSDLTIKGTLKNRAEYSTEFDVSIINDFSIKEFCFNDSHFSFLRISDLKPHSSATNDLTIFIPVKFPNLISEETYIQTNIVVIENKFTTFSTPFFVKQGEETPLPKDQNFAIRLIKNIQSMSGEIIPNVKENINGWHTIITKQGMSLFIDGSWNGGNEGHIIAEIECYNTNHNLENISFEEYLPGKVFWNEMPGNYHLQDEINEVTRLIQFMHIDHNSIHNSLNFMSEILSIYNNSLNVQFQNISTLDTIKPIKISNYVLPKIHKLISCSTNTNNFLLLRHIIEEIKNKTDQKLDFLFNSPMGEMYYE